MSELMPNFNIDPPAKAQQHHAAALDFLDQHGIPPNPICYAIAYEYDAGRKPELNQEIESHLKRGRELDAHFLREFFNTHFLGQPDEKVGEHIADLHNLLYKVLEGVSGACSGAADFGKVLEAQTEELKGDVDMAGLKVIAGNLLTATNKAMTSNQAMRVQLETVEKDTSELKDQVKQLQDQASRDALTGLYNRHALSQKLDAIIELGASKEAPVSLLMVDIDHFKRFNDNFGHLIGDEVIRRVSMALQKGVRDVDVAARFGGEEFTVVLPDTGLAKAMEVAQKLHEAISKLVLVRRSTKEKLPGITVSMGASCLHPGDSRESLIERADQALYHAKESGRNRIVSEAEALVH
ncbi:MAG: GGDEF domain-containing protein [gamma proteobacterium endosymbiont of Lamellibrachia anaximandri]|nr:GGDEF domain-containing protein [gamma proteobacterium endosymbiont of Lamellibrachia anaximandri]MBL3618720.1 GGDEF domain-containing protein [gamma proteobacterium endosymbiont of Lamellibrachia anaximandri]